MIFTRYPAKLSGYQMSVVHLLVWKQTVFMQTTKDTEMKKFDPNQLNQFTGTAKYYRISRRHLLTEGTKYLAEEAECFWMMDAIASHLVEIGTADWFVVVKTSIKLTKAVMVYEDGTGNELARQEIPYTDLPLAQISLYACWDGEHWVIMLPSEYWLHEKVKINDHLHSA